MWAKEAGLSANAPRTLDNQRIIVRHKVGVYWVAFDDWRKVAIAWYAGPDVAVHPERYNLNRKQGRYPSINAYADSVMAKACGG